MELFLHPSNTSSWRGASFSTETALLLHLYSCQIDHLLTYWESYFCDYRMRHRDKDVSFCGSNTKVSSCDLLQNMQIHVTVIWVMTPCSVEVGYQRFGGSCCLHLQAGILLQHWSHKPEGLARLYLHRPENLKSRNRCNKFRLNMSAVHCQRYRLLGIWSLAHVTSQLSNHSMEQTHWGADGRSAGE